MMHTRQALRLVALLALLVAVSSASPGWAQDTQETAPEAGVPAPSDAAPPPLSSRSDASVGEAATEAGGILNQTNTCADLPAHYPRYVCATRKNNTDLNEHGSSILILWIADGVAAFALSIILGYLFWRVSQLSPAQGPPSEGRESPAEQTNKRPPDGKSPSNGRAARKKQDPRQTDSFVSQNYYLIRAFQAILFLPLALIALVHLYALSSFFTGQSYLVDFAKPAFVSLCMLAIGSALGALFGLPSRDPSRSEQTNGHTYAQFGDRLEQVADWLTKLLLGAGLTQIGWVWNNRDAMSVFFTDATGMVGSKNLGLVVAMGSLTSGFLLGYVTALLFLPVALQSGYKVLVGMSSPPAPQGHAGEKPTPVEAAVAEQDDAGGEGRAEVGAAGSTENKTPAPEGSVSGSAVIVGDRGVVTTDRGVVVAVEPKPEKS